MMYKEYDFLRYGILFTRDPSMMGETSFYGTEKERDEAIDRIKETGLMLTDLHTTPLGKFVEVYRFCAIEAGQSYRLDKAVN